MDGVGEIKVRHSSDVTSRGVKCPSYQPHNSGNELTGKQVLWSGKVSHNEVTSLHPQRHGYKHQTGTHGFMNTLTGRIINKLVYAQTQVHTHIHISTKGRSQTHHASIFNKKTKQNSTGVMYRQTNI